jgi:acyl carrier protein
VIEWPDSFEDLLRGYIFDPEADFTDDPDRPLADLGLDSVNLVGLMVGLETEFGFEFPEHRITVETFYSVRSLWAVVAAEAPADARRGRP